MGLDVQDPAQHLVVIVAVASSQAGHGRCFEVEVADQCRRRLRHAGSRRQGEW